MVSQGPLPAHRVAPRTSCEWPLSPICLGCNAAASRAALHPLRRRQPDPHGLTLGITAVTSTSRSMRPDTSPSCTQSNACHQSSYPRRADVICSGCGRQVTGQARTSIVRHLPLTSTLSVPTTTLTARSPWRLRFTSTGTQRGTTPGIQSGVSRPSQYPPQGPLLGFRLFKNFHHFGVTARHCVL